MSNVSSLNQAAAISLNQKNLRQLPSSVKVPSYNRSELRTGIVHVGVGGFHRSHEAFYTDEYMQSSGDLSWGICGIGLREGDRKMQGLLKQQDNLYTLLVKHPNGSAHAQVIACLTDFLLAGDNPQAVVDKMAHADTKIVSLTITEGGYNYDPVTDAFDFSHPDAIFDLQNLAVNNACLDVNKPPRLVFTYLAAALKVRKEAGEKAFTVQSCDNIQHNGNMTRNMLLAYVEHFDPELAKWISEEVCFPNAMVDRITPATFPEDTLFLKNNMQLEDAWPVVCEPFAQWIIEDKFSDARPLWEKVGAQFVSDVTPYEKMKIRLLNAGHSVLGILGSIEHQATIDKAVSTPIFGQYLRLFMDTEATPALDPVEGIDISEYKDILFERFANPNIKDKLERICLDSSSKINTFLVPTVLHNLQTKGSIKLACLVLAAWCYYSDKRVNDKGEALDINDPLADELHACAKHTQSNKLAFLDMETVFGELKQDERFVAEYEKQVSALYASNNIVTQMRELISTYK